MADIMTKLSDLIDPEVMADMVSARIPKKLRVAPFAKIDDTLAGVPGDTITVPKALERLMRDVGVAESAIGRCVKVPLSQSEYDAFTSFAFNAGGEAFCSSTLVKKLNAGDYDGACKELERWVFVQKKRVEGLANRREDEYKLCTQE